MPMENHIPFHEQLKYERERRGWSQADLAEKVRCDTKTVGRWESGERIPRSYYRQALCELFSKSAEELGLVKMRPNISSSPPIAVPQASLFATPMAVPVESSTTAGTGGRVLLREDWSEAPQAVSLYGRDKERLELAQWLGDRRCRVVAVVGIGGIGKTALATTVAERMKASFASLFWRSLQNAPPLELILKQCLRCISDQQVAELPKDVDEQIAMLIGYLRSHRCLLVLDNVDSILQAGRRSGRYRQGYESYRQLIRCIAEAQHQSCLLLTSREKPKEVAQLEGKTSPVRSLHLAGIEQLAGQELLKDRDLFGTDDEWAALVNRYSGNPLALQLASEAIREVFGGDISRFLQQEASAFGDINDVLDQQFQRLPDEEREIMDWLAIEREAIALEDLRENLVHPTSAGAVLETLDSLRRRSMIETRSSAHFTLQPVIMEYVTAGLIERACREFADEAGGVWMRYALMKAKTKNYVRESQVRLLLAPVAQRLLAGLGQQGIEQTARNKLSMQRQEGAHQPGYVAGNLLNLLTYLQCDLRGFDFSHLVVREAYLQQASLPGVNFAHTRFIASIFTSTFGSVLSIACSLRGNLFAAGTATGDVWIYQLERSTLQLTCHGHTDGVWSLAFSPDGHTLASSSDDHTIRLWDIDTGRCLHILQSHANRVRAVAFSPDGKCLASGSDDQTVRLWDANTGHCLNILQGHTNRVWAVTFNPGGNILATGSTDQTIRLWDLDAGRCFSILEAHKSWVRSVAFRLNGKLLASGSDDQTVRIWDVNSGDCLTILRGHSSPVWSVAFAPDGRVIASGSEDQTIRFWDVDTGRCLNTLQGHMHGVRSIAFNSNGRTLVSGSDDQSCRLWDPGTGDCLKTLQGYTNRVWSVAFSPDGALLASASEDQMVRFWDVETGNCFRTLNDKTHNALVLAFSPDGQMLASGGQDQTVRLWHASTGRSLKTLRGHTNWIRAVTFSPDGVLLASAGEDQTICLWDVNTAQHLRTLKGHSSWVRSVAFHPDGQLLASGSDDQTVRLWDVSRGDCLTILRAHTNRVRSVAFSPDGSVLASGGEDQTVRLWDVDTGQCLAALQGHNSWVRSVAFSPHGGLLASSGEDQTIYLWDVNTGHCLNTLHGHTSRIRCVTFSPDGNILSSSADDGIIKLWNIQTAACLKTLAGERPYERMNITDIQGLTEVQKASLLALGAVEENQE
jgi:WD40 repeat protein/transcriptional regulator with XRE-family HTH domain